MVCQWGMSDKLGMVAIRQRPATSVFMGRDMVQRKDYSEFTAQEIDTEVKRIINEAYHRAKNLIDTHRDKLEIIANALLEYETLDGEQVSEIVRDRHLHAAAAGAQGRAVPPAPSRPRRCPKCPSRCRPSCPVSAPPPPPRFERGAHAPPRVVSDAPVADPSGSFVSPNGAKDDSPGQSESSSAALGKAAFLRQAL